MHLLSHAFPKRVRFRASTEQIITFLLRKQEGLR